MSLFLEEAAELVHHAVAATALGRRAAVGTTGRTGRALVALAVLLVCVLCNAAHDRTTDRSEETVVGLVAGKATGGTTGEGTSKTTLAFLGLAGSTLLLLVAVAIAG